MAIGKVNEPKLKVACFTGGFQVLAHDKSWQCEHSPLNPKKGH